ncbi:CopG family transcriptional regulator [bacterium C-53]|nr:CopG family transcriptional regulator [Lachnospiraceae bacterium]NBI03378.1 CopG family transcriptional regulator [Lachnospiraceae bacterium]RKJ09911.1 CopG family transcriptional regulator [bacterium C-53]
MSKMGRPKSDVVKDHIVTIRMSDEEYLMLKEYSKKHQQTLTATIKSAVDLLYHERSTDKEI